MAGLLDRLRTIQSQPIPPKESQSSRFPLYSYSTFKSENTEETKDASVRRQSFTKKPSLSSNISPSKVILPRTAQEEADKQSIRRMKSVGTLNQGLNAARRRRKRRSIAGGHFPHPPPEEKPKFN